MLYTAREPTSVLVPTAPFIAKGINLAPAKLSDLEMKAKPTTLQLAYGEYAWNLPAFMYATATKAKAPLGLRNYPFPDKFIPTIPLPLPPVIFQLDSKKKLSKEAADKLEVGLKAQGGTLRDLGGSTGKIWLVERPTFSAIRSALPGLCNPSLPFIEPYAKTHAASALTTAYQFIEAFLSTQSYTFKGDWDKEDTHMKPTHLNPWKRKNLDDHAPVAKTAKAGKRKAATTSMDVDREDTPSVVTMETMEEDLTASAKPSPLPSKINWGGPEDVPNLPGILFPYFPGMIIPDIKFIRLAGFDLFFRNLPGSDCHTAWANFRSSLVSVAETPEGQIISHILLGADLALNAQARLFVIIDAGIYHGFVLLGEKFTIYKGGAAHYPVSADILRGELSTIKSVLSLRVEIVELLTKLSLFDHTLYRQDQENFCEVVADCLSKVNESDAEIKGIVDDLSRALGEWVSTFKYMKMTPENVVKTVGLLLDDQSIDIAERHDRDFNFYIPRKDWKNVGLPQYPFFARFGPQAFSFRNKKGDEYPLNPLTDHFAIVKKPAKKDRVEGVEVKKQNFMYGYLKPTGVCLTDWIEMLRKGSVRQDGKERAAPQRAEVIRSDADVAVLLGYFRAAENRFPKFNAPMAVEVIDVPGAGSGGQKIAEDGTIEDFSW